MPPWALVPAVEPWPLMPDVFEPWPLVPEAFEPWPAEDAPGAPDVEPAELLVPPCEPLLDELELPVCAEAKPIALTSAIVAIPSPTCDTSRARKSRRNGREVRIGLATGTALTTRTLRAPETRTSGRGTTGSPR